MVVEHERVFFPSFPYEWPPEMLYAAGRLTLDLALDALADGWELKDATPFNVLFRGPEPMFVDVPSFEHRRPGSSVWLAYGQFVRTFVLPLLANKHLGVPLRWIFTGNREGLDPGELYRMSGWRHRLSPPFLTLATIPTFLARNDPVVLPRRPVGPVASNDVERAEFVTRAILRGLRRALDAAKPRPHRRSAWTSYTTAGPHDDAYHGEKRAQVEQLVRAFAPRTILDVGANDGHVARAAARAGAVVVAIDRDERVVGVAFDAAKRDGLPVLPLVVDLVNPPGPTGWRNRECASFLDRAAGKFDVVLFLAVIHHLMVAGGVPLDEIIALAAELTCEVAVIEFVPRDDPMFRQLLRGRDASYDWFTTEAFEDTCRRFFRIERSTPLGSTSRRLYVLRKQ
jgi:SAM-dependent methyltransferase